MHGCGAGEQEAQLLVRGNALAGSLGLDQGPAALAEKQAFTQLKAVRRLLRSEARCAPLPGLFDLSAPCTPDFLSLGIAICQG